VFAASLSGRSTFDNNVLSAGTPVRAPPFAHLRGDRAGAYVRSQRNTAMTLKTLALGAAPLALLAAAPAHAVDETFDTRSGAISVQTFADGLTEPWGMAFLPEGGLLVTEKQGSLRHVGEDGTVGEPISGLPEV